MLKVGGKSGRNRFLYHIPWLVEKAKMNWDRWGELHGNLGRCELYFQKDPCWFTAYQVWRLIHQMAAFTEHPDLIQARDMWRRRMIELDEGELSDREASIKLISALQAGLTAGELRRIRKMCMDKPNWRWNPEALKIVRQVDGRLGKKTHQAA